MKNIVLLLIICFVTSLAPSTSFAVGTKKVPKFINAPVKKVVAELESMGFKVRIEDGAIADKIKEVGMVDEVSHAGQSMPVGSLIVVRAYRFVRPVNMMDFRTYKTPEAVKFFEDRGIPVQKTAAFVAGCHLDTVISQIPAGGTPYNPGQVVSLSICSKGARTPDLTGKTSRDIANLHLPFKIEKTGQVASNSKVAQQNPPPGTIIANNSVITLQFVSDGVQVPQLVGMSLWKLETYIKEIGIKTEVVGPASKNGTITKQSIPAGTKVPWGTLVKIEVK